MDIKEAYNILLQADRFSGPMVGVSGQMPDTVKAFLNLLQSPRAEETFSNLLEQATLAGQLYALCGLYYADPHKFKEQIEEYRHRDDMVTTQFECKVGGKRVSELVEYKHPSAVHPALRLVQSDQTFKASRERHEGRYVAMDILGGGYPAHFREFESRLTTSSLEPTH